MKKVKILLGAGVLIFLCGLVVFIYPFAKSYAASRKQEAVVYETAAVMKNTDQDILRKMRQEAESYNRALAGIVGQESLSEGRDDDSEDTYNQCLDFANGVMGTLEIPAIHVDLPIYHGTTDEVLAKGVGHLYGTSLPIGGSGTHAVLISHSGLADATLFTHLEDLACGDIFYVTTLNQKMAYEVDSKEIVEPNEISALAPIAGEDHVTLITCYPITINTHRLLVRGTRAPQYEGAVFEAVSGEEWPPGAATSGEVFAATGTAKEREEERESVSAWLFAGAGAAFTAIVLLLSALVR